MAKSQRRIWFVVHGWLSLPVWLLFTVICLTGTIAVISHELTWLFNPDARAHNPQQLERLPLPELVTAVEQTVPGADVSSVMQLESYLVTAVSFAAPDIPQAIAYVNPYSGEVQAINRGITFIGFMRSLHGWLLFPWHHSYSIGYYLVSLMSIVVLGAMITGLVVYKRFWRAFTRPRLRAGKGARIFWGDLHRLGGVWSLWFLLVIGLTGLWYLVQAILWHNEVEAWQHPDPIALTQVPLSDGQAPQRLPLNDALNVARQTLPDVRLKYVSMPEHPQDFYTVAGGSGNPLFDDYSQRVFVNPWNGDVAQVRETAGMNTLQVITHIADPLHYGTIGGLFTKVIWFVFGLVLSGMAVSGFVIYSKRTLVDAGKRARKPARQRHAATARSLPGESIKGA
jgi:uncharacterized iron-regulated membrane protein